ncbi:mechanosensitive ion channel family protein [Corallococcus sp. 4LFB]|uniref:mechanosensitive ion channel family protein n=1 Tax=Corallococcus sp. 4LFB TaxID=3383249 RepID=UPI0039769849
MRTLRGGFQGRALAGVGALLVSLPARAQDAPDVGRLAEFIRWGGVAASIPVFIGALFLIRLVEDSGDRLSARFSNRRPSIQKVQTTVRFFIYVATIALVASLSIRLDPTALTVIGGALAFAVGFALRDLVASFIAGITIMFDRPFQVGDRVSYGGEYGDIIKIGLRSVRMNTLDHNIITIPNNKVFTDVTSSGNYGELEMQVAMDFYIGVDQDAKLAAEIIREACLTSPYVYLDQSIPVLAKQVILQDYVAVHLKARPYVFDCKYEKPFETDVHFRVLQAFRERGIQPPAVLHRSLDAPRPGQG